MLEICEISPTTMVDQLSSFRSCLGNNIAEISWVEFPFIHRINYFTTYDMVFLLLKSLCPKSLRNRACDVVVSIGTGHARISSLHFDKLCLSVMISERSKNMFL